MAVLPPKPGTKAKSRKLKDVTFTLNIAYDVKSRCIDSQRQAIIDSHLNGNNTEEAIWDTGTKALTLTDHTQA